MPPEPAEALAAPVYIDGAYKPFGELSVTEVRARAQELSGDSAWGPLMHARAVGMAWTQLAADMERAGAGRVGDLDPEAVVQHAERTWAVPRLGA